MRRLDRADLPLLLAVVAELLVLVLLPRVVTVDGPAHVLGGWVLAHPHDPLLSRYYDIDLGPVPNLVTSVLLAGLLRVLGADAAEKALVAGYVVLLPLGLRYALRGVDPRAGWLAVVAVPLTPHYLFTYGFYNLCLALGMSLVVMGLALRQREGWTVRSAALLAVLLVVTWSTHLLPLLVAALLVGLLALTRLRAAGRAGLVPHVLPVVVAAVPTGVLSLLFVLSDAASRGAPERDEPRVLFSGLLGLSTPLVSYDPDEVWPARVLALVLLGLGAVALHRRPGGPERQALAVCGLLVTAWYFVSPERYGPQYGFLNDRLSLFPPLLLLLWAALPPPRPVQRYALVAVVLGCAVTVGVLRAPTEARYQREVAELVSVADAVPPGSRLLKVQLWRDPPADGDLRNPYRDALRHEVSRLAVLTRGIDVGHYEAVTDYFPARFRPATDPRAAVDPDGAGLWKVPPQQVTVRPDVVDVVVVLGRRRASARQLRLAAPVLADLEAGYRRVEVSERTGLAEVWVRR
ncbi:MAG: hypothetical protein JWO60_3095 [Frankiales bacterium]|nr:hypothetical protein [Frankiales bacterium]